METGISFTSSESGPTRKIHHLGDAAWRSSPTQAGAGWPWGSPGETDGEMPMYVDAASELSTLVRSAPGRVTETVAMRRIADLFPGPIDVLKLDVQGHELSALLRGAAIWRGSGFIYAEVKVPSPPTRRCVNFPELNAYLNRRGFFSGFYGLFRHGPGKSFLGSLQRVLVCRRHNCRVGGFKGRAQRPIVGAEGRAAGRPAPLKRVATGFACQA